jgi:putative dehydrogenase
MSKAAVIGLGSMGFGMARSLLRAGFDVAGFDVSADTVARFAEAGGRAATTPADAARGAATVIAVVVNAAQTEAILFGENGCAAVMEAGSVFVSSATMAPDVARRLAARLEAMGPHYLDAPMSGGAARAEEGKLTMLASGSTAAFAAARPALDAMTATLYELGDEPGQGAAFKAMAFAARQNLDLHKVYDVITASAGNSWMFENRMTHVLEGDYSPKSSVSIFTKDLGIVLDMARSANFPVPLASSALQMFLMTAAAGMAGDDDSSVTRLYAQLAGLKLPGDAA